MAATKGSKKVPPRTRSRSSNGRSDVAPKGNGASGASATKARAAAPKRVKGPAAKAPSESSSAHSTVEAYIGSLSGWQSSVVRTICNIVRATAPNARESINRSQPTYEENGPFCYVKADSGTVNFGFWRGAELNDPRRLLKGDEQKMRHVNLKGERDVDPRAFAAFVKQAVELNRRLGDPSR